jgi:predicted nucleic acid-binding protein
MNRADRYHAAAVEWFSGYRGLLLTTEAVVTETAYVLAASRPHQSAALLWFNRARTAELLQVEPIASYAALNDIIERYAKLPCEYADATLIELAERSGINVIATVDQRDFPFTACAVENASESCSASSSAVPAGVAGHRSASASVNTPRCDTHRRGVQHPLPRTPARPPRAGAAHP